MLNRHFLSANAAKIICHNSIVLLLAFGLGLMAAVWCVCRTFGTWCFSGLFSDSAHKSLNKFIYTLFRILFSTNILCFVVLFVDKLTLQMFYDYFICRFLDVFLFSFLGGRLNANTK